MPDLDELLMQVRGGRSQGGGADLDSLLEQVRAGGQQGRSVPYAGPDESIAPQPMPEEPAWYDGLMERFNGVLPGGVLTRGALNPGINAAAQGFAHGATSGVDQNIPGYGDFVRDERAAAQAAQPGVYGAADAVGGMVNPANLTGGVARQMGGAAIQGAARSFSDADPEQSVGLRAVNAGQDAVKSAGLAGLVSGGAKLVGAAASGISNGVRSVADRARNIGWGTPKDELAAFAQQRGLSPDDALTTFVREGEAMAPPNLIVPKSPSAYQPQFQAAQNRFGQGVDDTLGAIEREGVATMDPNAQGTLLRRLDNEADAAITAGTNRMPYATALQGEAAAVARGPAISTPQQLRQTKTAFGNTAFGEDPNVGQAAARKAADFGRETSRDMLGDYVNQASPELSQQFATNNQGFGVAKTLNDATTNRANAINTGSGGGIGGGIGFMGQLGSMIPGRAVLPDAAANAGNLIAKPLGAVGSAATGFGNEAPIGAMASQNDDVRAWLSNKGVQLDNVSQQTRGNRSADAALQLFNENPQAFGEWQPEFAEAVQRGPRAVGALIGKLEQDPRFRMGPYKQIQQATAGGSYAQ